MVTLVRPESDVTDLKEKKQFVPNPPDLASADITAKVAEEMDKDFPYPSVAPFPKHSLHNITPDEPQGRIRGLRS